MAALLAEGQGALHALAANLQEDFGRAQDQARPRPPEGRADTKRLDDADSNDGIENLDDSRVRDMATADAAMAAAEVRQAKVQDVYWQRVGEIRAETKARLHVYWAWNLAARSEAGRLLVAGLDLPELKDETALEWER